jgi:hypothetical protein
VFFCQKNCGDHRCKLCGERCHAVAPCSVYDAEAEEGYGASVTCSDCFLNETNVEAELDVPKRRIANPFQVKDEFVEEENDYTLEDGEVIPLEAAGYSTHPTSKQLIMAEVRAMHIVALENEKKSTQQNSSRRKRSVITLETKRQIIEASAGKSSSDLGKQFNLPPTTIRTILQSKETVLGAIERGNEAKRACIQPVKHANLEKAVFLWIKTVRSQNVPLSGPIVMVNLLFILLFLFKFSIYSGKGKRIGRTAQY